MTDVHTHKLIYEACKPYALVCRAPVAYMVMSVCVCVCVSFMHISLQWLKLCAKTAMQPVM